MGRESGRCSLSVVVPFVWRCLTTCTLIPFHIPLIETDVQLPGIRLSDKTFRLRAYLAAPSRTQVYETEVPAEVRE